VASSQPGSAGEYVFAGLVPVDGVDDGLEPMLDVPDCAAKRVARVVGSDGEAVEGRREGRRERLVRLRVLERLDEGEVAAISSVVGGCRRKLWSAEAVWAYEYDTSASDVGGIVVAATGVEA